MLQSPEKLISFPMTTLGPKSIYSSSPSPVVVTTDQHHPPLNPASSLLGAIALLALWEAQVSLESSRVELRVDRINLDGLGIDVEVDDAVDLELVASNASGPPPPADLVAGVEHAQRLDDGERWRLSLAVNVGLLARVCGLAELWQIGVCQ